MNNTFALLEAMEVEDINWLLANGSEQQIISTHEFVRENEILESLFIILEGLVGVYSFALGDNPIQLLNSGQVVGELAFLDGHKASATVRAVENSLILELPHKLLLDHIDKDPQFAIRFYRALANLGASRLRQTVEKYGDLKQEFFKGNNDLAKSWTGLEEPLSIFKEVIYQADQEGIKNHDIISEKTADLIINGLAQFSILLNDTIGDKALLSDIAKQKIGTRIQRDLLPYVSMSHLGDRIYAKPRGYAGDFMTIDHMYQDIPIGAGRLGPIFDRAIRGLPANQAVINRRDLLKDEIIKVQRTSAKKVCHVTSLASGPAAELFDVFESLEDKSQLKATCIDIDLQALAFVSDKRDRKKLTKQIDLVNGNLVYLSVGRQKLDVPPQDLIYSIGLIDYFSDRFVIAMLNYIYTLLNPGGKVILGNFHPDNPSKAVMDYIVDWRLIHRDEKDMNRLFSKSDFARDCTEIRFEECHINLFASCIKPTE